jgi:hypothetical protein
MATPMNTPLNADIWHLSIDDLLAPLPETSRLGGAGPFVINLSVSTAPINVPTKPIAGRDHAQMYQIQRIEDGRPRYRLRFGPFADEDIANAILATVREIYPSALTATAADDDLRAIAAMQAKAEALQPHVARPMAQSPAPRPAEKVSAAVNPSNVVTSAAAPTSAAVPTAILPASPPTTQTPTLTSPIRPSPAQAVSAAFPRQTPAPAQAVSMPIPRSTPAPAQAVSMPIPRSTPAPAQAVSMPIPRQTATPPQAVSMPVPRQVERLSEPLANLESTQTVRLLTSVELEDDEALRWYVIQLSLSEQAFDPDAVPNLDIFSVYRLYSVAAIDQGHIMHALRLGFFGEEAAAAAVASYLEAYYDKPTVKRVSVAERERFADQTVEARKDVGATGRHSVIEITDELVVRKNRISHSTMMPETANQIFGQRTAARDTR